MDAKNYRQFIKESENQDEGKLVASQLQIISALMNKLKDRAEKELSKNQEKGIAFLNTIGSFVGAKVTDKKQAKNKLFLKMEYIKEDAAVDAANLKAKQAEEIERLKAKHEGEVEALKDRHEREQRAIDLQKEKETENKAIEAERESQRKAAQNESLEEDKEEQDRDVKDKEGTQPKKYYKGLDKKTKEKRDAHFKKKVSGPAPGDEDEDGKPIKTKPSVHTKKFAKMYGEKLDKNADAGDYVKDFRKSDAPQFKGKSDKKIQKMAIAAYLSKKEK
tara:strand:+ start:2687 stop:3514 length:828 start_codon:yes stop_codon:yes gene_type:complete